VELWYTEHDPEGIRVSYQTKEVLFSDSSEFQKVSVVETLAYGRMLLLDDLVMITDQDEFVYHEMIAHVPALLHPNPKRVVVIGGGDGGTVRELLRHPEIQEITLCEIDGLVVESCRKYFPSVASGLDDPRVTVKIGDGVAYMRDHEPGSLDLVLVDSTDPIGPGEGLFSREFYRNVARALKQDGLMACQSESPWFRSSFLERIQNNVAGGFPYRAPYLGCVPTYPRGWWSWTLAGQTPIDPSKFSRSRLDSFASELSYLNAELLPAAFILPNFVREKFLLNR